MNGHQTSQNAENMCSESVISRVILPFMSLVNQAIILNCASAKTLMWSQTELPCAYTNKPSNSEKNTVW